MAPRGICRFLFLEVFGSHTEVSSQTNGIWRPYPIHDLDPSPFRSGAFDFLIWGGFVFSSIVSAAKFLRNTNILVCFF